MCGENKSSGCQHPENLKGKPGECSPEQIAKCHGDVKEHPCVKAECSEEQIKKCHGDVEKHPCTESDA